MPNLKPGLHLSYSRVYLQGLANIYWIFEWLMQPFLHLLYIAPSIFHFPCFPCFQLYLQCTPDIFTPIIKKKKKKSISDSPWLRDQVKLLSLTLDAIHDQTLPALPASPSFIQFPTVPSWNNKLLLILWTHTALFIFPYICLYCSPLFPTTLESVRGLPYQHMLILSYLVIRTCLRALVILHYL